MWIIQYDTNFPGNAQSRFWAQVISCSLCSAMVPKPLHHPEVFQTWVPRPENAEPLAVALILHSILALGLRLYSREGSPPCCSPPPSFPALGGPPQRRLRWDVSRGIRAEKPFQDQRLCSYLLLETEHRFGFTPPEELPVPAQALGSASRVSAPLVSLPGAPRSDPGGQCFLSPFGMSAHL